MEQDARRLQCRVAVDVEAAPAVVWEAIEDLTLIPRYHPVVGAVRLEPGQTRRAPGVAYTCLVERGVRWSCVERVVEHVPMERSSVAFVDDSWGIKRFIGNLLAEISIVPLMAGRTRVTFEAFYVPRGRMLSLLNRIVIRHLVRHRAYTTLVGLKKMIEAGH